MASRHTPNYKLSQWERTDKVLMEDFNGDNARIDGALAALQTGKAEASVLNSLSGTVTALSQAVARKQEAASAVKFASGSYTGNGAGSRTISVGFTPKAVLLSPANGLIAANNVWRGGLAVTGRPVSVANLGASVEIVSGGFRVLHTGGGYQGLQTNESGAEYHYIALG